MSDQFEAFEHMLNGEDEGEYEGWQCKTCERWHPHTHLSCWWCKPTKSKGAN